MRASSFGWLLAPALAASLLLTFHLRQVRHLEALTATAEWSVDPPAADSGSPTGFAHDAQCLVLADHSGRSQAWITQAERGWRDRHVDAGNAPAGYESHQPVLYAGLLRGLAALRRIITGETIGEAITRAACWLDPLVQLTLLFATTWFVRRQLGPRSALAIGVGFVALFPLNTAFLAGLPDVEGLATGCVLWSVLPLAVACLRTEFSRAATARHFALAGVAGGIGCWLAPPAQIAVLGGISAAAAIDACRQRDSSAPPPPWRLWAGSGAAMLLLGAVIQRWPDGPDLRWAFSPPVGAFAWIIVGIILEAIARMQRLRHFAGVVLLTVFIAAGIAIPFSSLLPAELASSRLTRADGGVIARSLGDWLATEGASARSLALVLTGIVPAFAAAVVLRPRLPAPRSAALLVALLPTGLILGASWNHVHDALTLDALVLTLVAVGLAGSAKEGPTRPQAAGWSAVLTVAGCFGLLAWFRSWPPRHAGEVSALEARALLERDLAHWLAQRRPGAVVLAPPDLSASLAFAGGLRVIGTADPDNRDGFIGAARIAAATSFDEAARLLERRGITHIVLPAWDRTLDDTARALTTATQPLFVAQLRDWQLPLWLRPVPYFQPAIDGLPAPAFTVLEVVPEQSPPTAIARMVECFLETDRLNYARALAPYLERYPLHLGALVSLAEIRLATNDATAQAAALQSVETALDAGADAALAWDRRVDLAVVLTRATRVDAAHKQLRRCLAELDEPRLRLLTTQELFRFQVLCRSAGLEIGDDHLRAFALQLLPPALRARLP